MDLNNFGFFWYDYIILITMLAISTSIGIYYGCCGSRQRTVNEYLLGNKQMSAVPVGLSIAVGHISAIAIMVVPADIYKYGAFFLWGCVSMILLSILSVYVMLPVFFKLQITSLYEYLEIRFDSKCRILTSFLFVLYQLLYLPIVAYVPALALSAATGFQVSLIVAVFLSICVFYTSIGGLKSVVWTDFLQLTIIIICLISVSVIGVNSTGGLKSVLKKAVEGGRFDIFDFSLDPTRRDTFWTYIIGFTLYRTTAVSLSQDGVQKFLALRTFRDVVWAVIVYSACNCLILAFDVLMGSLLYFKYFDCDPFLSNKIKKHEQVLPYYVMDVAGHLPGISGFFVVSLLCAALSTLSSSLNALSGVIYKDFISIFFKNLSEKASNTILKLNVVVCGAICFSIAVLLQHSGDLYPLFMNVSSISHGPTLGIFTLGILFPKAKAKGAFYGTIAGSIVLVIILFPETFIYGTNHYPSKTLSVHNCTIQDETETLSSHFANITISRNNTTVVPFIFRISHMYHCFIGALVTIFVGLVISFVTKEENATTNQNAAASVHLLLPQKSNNKTKEETK